MQGSIRGEKIQTSHAKSEANTPLTLSLHHFITS